MLKRLESRDVPSIAQVCGLFALLCVNVAVGLSKGFDHPDGGFLVRVLASPGIALGWGGVVLLLVALPYALLAWIRGRRAGKLLSILGALVFALGVGGLAGVFSAPATAGGGRLAGGLAALLKGSLGAGLAASVFAVLTIPGILLALAPLILESGVVRVVERATKGGVTTAKPWYPERKIGPDGEEEEPVQFAGAHDVGAPKFRDDSATPKAPEPPTSTVSLSPPPVAGPAVRKAKPIAGIRYADGGADDVPLVAVASVATTEAASPEPAPSLRPSREPKLARGVRYADSPASASVAVAEPPPSAATQPEPAPPPPPPEMAVAAPSPPPVVATRPAAQREPALASDHPSIVAAEPAIEQEPVGAAATAPAIAPLARVEPHPAAPPKSSQAAVAAALAGRASALVAASGANARADDRPMGGDAYRRKLAATGLIDSAHAETATIERPTRVKARPMRPKDVHAAIRGLFSSLPLDELPAAQPAIDPPEPAPEPRVEAPGQTALLFDATAASPGRHPASTDALFGPSVEAAIERGSASLVLLKRKLGVGYARAASLMEALVSEGILGEMTASGSRPTLLSAAEWAKRSKSKSR